MTKNFSAPERTHHALPRYPKIVRGKRFERAGLLVAIYGFLVNAPISHGESLLVPTGFPTIQSCIDAAANGDECRVASGTYYETINFNGKGVTLRSLDGPAITTINGTKFNNSVATCANGEGPDTSIIGFTITGGTGTQMDGQLLGGGLYNSGASPIVADCTFAGNSANFGGGIFNDSNSNPTISSCTFAGNTAGSGGAIYNAFSSPQLDGCKFDANTVTSVGGAIGNWQSSPIISHCMFRSNKAGIYGGAIYSDSLSDSTIVSNLFVGNFATLYGGAIKNYNSTATIENCTFAGNQTESASGALANHFHSTATVRNCIFWGNTPNELGNISSMTTVSSCDVRSSLPADIADGGGNIDLDPLFVRPPDPGPDGQWDGIDDDYGDLRLSPGSPCINTGDPNATDLSPTDLDGHARVLCDRVDMGAYEFGIGDADCDQDVDLTDFATWPGCVTNPESLKAFGHGSITETLTLPSPLEREKGIECQAFDFNANSTVDLLDFAGLQVNWSAP